MNQTASVTVIRASAIWTGGSDPETPSGAPMGDLSLERAATPVFITPF